MGFGNSSLARSRRGTHLQSFAASHEYNEADADIERGSITVWDFTDDRLHPAVNWMLKQVLRTLCLISFGHTNLQPIFDTCHAPHSVWQETTDRLYERLNTIIVSAGLLLSSTAAFISTSPPLPNTLNYNEGGPYLCLFISWGLSLGTLVIGSSIMFFLSKSDPVWFERTHLKNRSRIVCTMWLVAYPFISMGASTTMAALGLLAAACTASDKLILRGAVWLLLLPMSCVPLWIWTQYNPGEERNRRHTTISKPPSNSSTTALPGAVQAQPPTPETVTVPVLPPF